MRKGAFVMIAVTALGGCAHHQYAWYRPGATYQQEKQVEYTCLQNSKMEYAQGFQYGATAAVKRSQTEDKKIFSACMGAQGFYLAEIAKGSGLPNGAGLPPQ
jgi:hypothetical protein